MEHIVHPCPNSVLLYWRDSVIDVSSTPFKTFDSMCIALAYLGLWWVHFLKQPPVKNGEEENMQLDKAVPIHLDAP
jgi:hypothetical protein